jgi:hypothetical protein
VPASVPWKKIDSPSGQASADDHVGRFTEGRLDLVFGDSFEAFDLIKAASSDDPDGCWFRHAPHESSLARAAKR